MLSLLKIWRNTKFYLPYPLWICKLRRPDIPNKKNACPLLGSLLSNYGLLISKDNAIASLIFHTVKVRIRRVKQCVKCMTVMVISRGTRGDDASRKKSALALDLQMRKRLVNGLRTFLPNFCWFFTHADDEFVAAIMADHIASAGMLF